jgi:hypothetical protein
MWKFMLDRISNKLLALGGLFIVSLFFQGKLQAFPEYTSRENAINLADVLDKGFFRSSRITSVFVKNRGEDEYYLQAILDDGSSRLWTLDSIYDWSKNDDLILSGNRALIFPVSGSTEFDILYKNDFYRMVLQAGAYLKTFGAHDPMEGKSILLAIRKFRIIDFGEEGSYSTDEMGHRYRYVLEMENGIREFLTYYDAYRLFQSGAFITPSDGNVVHQRPYQVRELAEVARHLEDELHNIWSFGVEIIFDRPVELLSEQFGYQIIEQDLRDPETGKRRNHFFVNIVFPNTIKNRDVPGFRNLDYLSYVEIVTDVEHQMRVMLRAQVNPEALELPPYVEVTDRNSVIIHFFSVTDQSIARRKDFMQSRSPMTMAGALISPNGPQSPFELEYLKAVELIRSAQRQPDTHLKVETYLGAIEALRKSSMQAENDAQITQALKQRDVMLKVLPEMIISNSQMTILALQQSGQQVTDDNRKQLQDQLNFARKHAVMDEQLQKIESLLNILK